LRAIAELNGVQKEAPKPAVATTSHDAAERRQVTMMFSDLVGSTALSTLKHSSRNGSGCRSVTLQGAGMRSGIPHSAMIRYATASQRRRGSSPHFARCGIQSDAFTNCRLVI
jgi:hypothetical protein